MAKLSDKVHSQTVRALLDLRELILSGELQPGERISELAMVGRIGVSRTPLRAALIRLESEGMLEAIPSGGFAVRGFTEQDIFTAIEIRGAMEGLAARFAAERSLPPNALKPIKDCLARIDALIEQDLPDKECFSAYVPLNDQFHELLKQLSGSTVISQQIERANAHPFASASGFVGMQAGFPEARTILIIAQDQHRCIVEAIENREGGRAEAMMREHARLAHRNLTTVLANKQSFNQMPGAALLRAGG